MLEDTFHFVEVNDPSRTGVTDRRAKRLARSHAVKQALERKRLVEEQSGLNFRIGLVGTSPMLRRPGDKKRHGSSLAASSPLALPDPLRMLAERSPKLHTLLKCSMFGEAREPVFSIADELVLPNFRQVFENSPDDPALLNATMLTFSISATGAIRRDSLSFQNQAFESIRTRMSSPDRNATESILAAILLLAGVEARLDMSNGVQLHMDAVQQLLSASRSQDIYLSDGMKRAIFWQDLNSSVMTRSKRIVDHTTFPELQWRRDPLTPSAFMLPPGFRTVSHLLTREFIEILEDIHALQCIRDSSHVAAGDAISMAQIDNHQASIQSRLVNMPETSDFVDCCYLGAFLCSALLRCKLWPASVLSPYLSSRLLQRLQKSSSDPMWDAYPDVLIWLLIIGGAFSSEMSVRSDYIALIHLNYNTRFGGPDQSRMRLLDILRRFIWSEVGFLSQVTSFLKEIDL